MCVLYTYIIFVCACITLSLMVFVTCVCAIKYWTRRARETDIVYTVIISNVRLYGCWYVIRDLTLIAVQNEISLGMPN